MNSATIEEASKESYDNLFETINSTLTSVENAGAYDQLSINNGIFILLYDQRISMAQVNVDQEEVLNLLERAYNNAKSLSVQKEQSKKLQEEIVDNYENYKQAIERAYINAKERA